MNDVVFCSQGARCLFATHYHALAQDLAKSPSNATRISAWHMGAVVGEGDAVRFTYELTPGPAPLGSVSFFLFSNCLPILTFCLIQCAMNVARIAGFPADLLKRAKDVADKSALSGALASAPDGVNDGMNEPAACEEPLSEEEAALVQRLTSDPVVCGEAEADEAWVESLIETQKLCVRL
jgi:DNA mismatch repair ATPase MutS